MSKCSRAGCQQESSHLLTWRNPKIHSVDRVKTWAACDEHLDFLRGYLAERAFLIQVTAA